MNRDDELAFREWAQRVRAHLLPMLRDSSVNVSLVPDEVDIKFAVELGLSIMLDKPIVAVVPHGRAIPGRLARVADHVIEGDIETAEGRDAVQAALQVALRELLPDDDEASA